jgi:hypothetical protein
VILPRTRFVFPIKFAVAKTVLLIKEAYLLQTWISDVLPESSNGSDSLKDEKNQYYPGLLRSILCISFIRVKCMLLYHFIWQMMYFRITCKFSSKIGFG